MILKKRLSNFFISKVINFFCGFIPSRRIRRSVRAKYILRMNSIGSNNKIIVENKSYPMGYYAVNGLIIRCTGENNTVEIENPDIFKDSEINIESDNSYIKIKNAKYVHNLNVSVYYGYNQQFIFGSYSSVEEAKVFLCGANVKCIVGDECMLSSGIEIWTSDGHSIIDIASNEIINDVSAPLVIGDRCWIGREVRILKNANIPPDTIVGAGAVIAKCFVERFTALAGNPAKVIKKSVMWDRGIPHELKKERKHD